MITEDYVSFETAKLLKEKGFYQDFLSEITPVWKLNGKNEDLVFYGCDGYPCESDEWYSAPTLQTAMKWLKETHDIFISPRIEVSRNEEETGIHQYGQPAYYVIITYVLNGNILPYQGILYPAPEQACEMAIKYCLENLI